MERYSCDDIRENLPGYVDNEADGTEAAAVEEHIKTCAECRRELEELLWLREKLDSAKPSPPRDLHEKIMSRVRAENTLAKTKKRRRLTRYLSVAAALVLVVGICAVWMQINGHLDNDSAGGLAPGAADAANKPCEDGMPGDVGNEGGEKADANNAPAGNYIDGDGCSVCDEIFSKYGTGYSGGYTVCVPDQDKAAELAGIFGVEFDGRAFTVPYTDETFDTLSQYGYAHCGGNGGDQCIIVFIK